MNTVQNFKDSKDLYNYFVYTALFDKEQENVNLGDGAEGTKIKDKYNNLIDKKTVTSVSNMLKNGTLLMVIDMQNDFVDSVFEGATGPDIGGGQRIGAFAVNDGKSIINPITELISSTLSSNGKVVYSRDVHPCNHCSFFKFDETCPNHKGENATGPFPPHCINTTPGSALVPAIKNIVVSKKNKYKIGNIVNDDVKQGIIFKGCHVNADSFGAFKYKEGDEYANGRQMGENCKTDNLEEHTGGFYSNPKYEKNPYDDDFNISNAKEDEVDNTGNLGDKFTVPDNLTSIFIVGLAGDYCVCDTAINLAIAYPTKTIHVLYDFCRNACIPFAEDNDFTVNYNDETDLTEIPIKYDGINYTLTHNDSTITKKNISSYFHFLTTPETIFDRYKQYTNIKVIIDPKNIIDNIQRKIFGGKRRRRRTKKRTRRTRKRRQKRSLKKRRKSRK